MELIAYFLVYFATIFFILRDDLLGKKFFMMVWFFLALFLSVALRLKINIEADSDISNYMRLMEIQYESDYFDREFLFFYGTRYIFNLTGSHKLVLFLLDCVSFALIYNSFLLFNCLNCKNLSRSGFKYLVCGFLLFFPVVEGLHTVYRQYLSLCFLLYAFGCFGTRKYYQTVVWVICSLGTHNSSGLFLSVFILMVPKFRFKFVLNGFALLIIFFMMVYINKSEDGLLIRNFSDDVSGANIPYYFLVVLVLIVGFCYVIDRSVREVSFNGFSLYGFLVTLIVVYIYSMFLFNSGASQRVVISVFFLVFPVIGFFLEDRLKSDVIPLRFLFFHLSLFPILFVFNTTINTRLSFN